MFEKIKNKLNDLYHFFVDRMWEDKEKRDKYYPVAYELYGKKILDEEQVSVYLELNKDLLKWIENQNLEMMIWNYKNILRKYTILYKNKQFLCYDINIEELVFDEEIYKK